MNPWGYNNCKIAPDKLDCSFKILDMHKMIFACCLALICMGPLSTLKAQTSVDSLLPTRGFCIDAPTPQTVDSFVTFIVKELAPRKVNTLLLLIDYRYQFTTHPELRDSNALSKTDVKKIMKACRDNHIRVIPQINLLGHQSWANTPGKLLNTYPQFDETPWIKFPADYKWPNADNLYCKSYCPLVPGLHEILFAVIDELCEVFETDAFHAGMDEVFYLGEDKCPRCGGKDRAELFAGEVKIIHDHLTAKGRQMWMWGDRFLDGKTTGLGEWEASYNDTYRAIDLIPKDIIICDWHYDRADKTAVLFAMKGLKVITCSWRQPAVGILQVQDMIRFRQESTPEMTQCFQGVMETTWSSAERFLRGFYGIVPESRATASRPENGYNTASNCFRAVFDEVRRQSTTHAMTLHP